jgi:5,10-methylenetetrahydromethanopterin reductase
MEFATIGRLFPGRFHAGIGHGVGDWMRQIGAFPTSQLAALEEVAAAVRALLAGETVTTSGRHVSLDGVKLDFPPRVPVPVSLGVRNTRPLAISGRVADGTILAEGSTPDYLAWAKEQIAATSPHRITVFTWWARAHDEARATVAGALRHPHENARLVPSHLADAVNAWRAGGADTADVPDAWVDELAFIGPPAAARHHARSLGVDALVLTPVSHPPF